MKRAGRILLVAGLCVLCAAGGYCAAVARGRTSTTVHSSTASQLVNAWIDNLQITGARLLDLPLFLMLAIIGAVALGGTLLLGRFGGTHRRVRWGRAVMITLVVVAACGAAMVTDRRLVKLQAQTDDLHAQLNSLKMQALQAEDSATAAPVSPSVTGTQPQAQPRAPEKPALAALDPKSRDAHSTPVASTGTSSTAPATQASAAGRAASRKTLFFDRAAVQKELDRTYSNVTLHPLVYDDASDVVQVHIGQPLVQAYLTVTDLKNPGVQLKVGGSLEKKTLTSAFAKDSACTIAINGEAGMSPFANSGLGQWRGYMVEAGQVLQKEQPGNPRPFLAFDRQNHAEFVPMAQTKRDLTGEMYNVLWGRLDALVDGDVKIENERDRQPRTAMGISADGSRLYLMVVDGRQPGYSMGFTRQDVGDFLKAFGATNGMLCDEGGSSCIYMGKFGGIVNVPSDNQGEERPTYTHFGVSFHAP